MRKTRTPSRNNSLHEQKSSDARRPKTDRHDIKGNTKEPDMLEAAVRPKDTKPQTKQSHMRVITKELSKITEKQ